MAKKNPGGEHVHLEPAPVVPVSAPASGSNVRVRITKFGDGKVSSGEHVAGEGDVMLSAGAEIQVSAATAEDLEARGFAETI